MRTESPATIPLSPSRCLHTLDVSADELAFLSSLIVAHVATLNVLLRSGAAGDFELLSLDRLHGEIRMGATLLGRFPLPRKDSRP